MEKAIARAAFAEAVALVRGGLLPGCYDESILAGRRPARRAATPGR